MRRLCLQSRTRCEQSTLIYCRLIIAATSQNLINLIFFLFGLLLRLILVRLLLRRWLRFRQCLYLFGLFIRLIHLLIILFLHHFLLCLLVFICKSTCFCHLLFFQCLIFPLLQFHISQLNQEFMSHLSICIFSVFIIRDITEWINSLGQYLVDFTCIVKLICEQNLLSIPFEFRFQFELLFWLIELISC